MQIEQVKKLAPFDQLVYWIKERESIRRKKEAGEAKPWTDDTILQQYRFCNVRRMDDRVSRWLLDNWYLPNRGHKNMLSAVALARFFNKPETLMHIGFPNTWDSKRLLFELRGLRKEGIKVFNAAYMVRGNDGVDKIGSVIVKNIQPLVDDPPEIYRTSMERTHASLSCYYGWGSFMSGQATADLRWAIDGTWRDRSIWAPVGPGSRRGMNRLKDRKNEEGLIKRKYNQAISQEQFNKELNELMNNLRKVLPPVITRRKGRELEAIDYQNCLCEFDKYKRTLDEDRRPKRIYPGVE